jgi:hypothetical protein
VTALDHAGAEWPLSIVTYLSLLDFLTYYVFFHICVTHIWVSCGETHRLHDYVAGWIWGWITFAASHGRKLDWFCWLNSIELMLPWGSLSVAHAEISGSEGNAGFMMEKRSFSGEYHFWGTCELGFVVSSQMATVMAAFTEYPFEIVITWMFRVAECFPCSGFCDVHRMELW